MDKPLGKRKRREAAMADPSELAKISNQVDDDQDYAYERDD